MSAHDLLSVSGAAVPRFPLGVVLFCVLMSPGAHSGESAQFKAESTTPSALLEAHLHQAARQREATPAPVPVVAEVAREVRQRTLEWNRRVPPERPVSAAPGSVLNGIPEVSLSKGRRGSEGDLVARLSSEVTLPDLLALVALRNPDALTSYEAWRATLRQFEQASFLEDSISQFRAFTRELDTKVGPQTHREMAEKTFAFPSALALRGQLVEVAARLGGTRYEQTLRKVLNDVGRSYFQVRYATRAIDVTRENRKLFADMESLTRIQLQVGAVSQADSLKSQSALAALDNQIAVLDLERSAEVARANALMGVPVSCRWGPLASVDLVDRVRPLSQVIAKAEGSSQEFKLATLEVDQMETMIRMAETETFPRGSFGASLIAPSAGADGGPTRSLMATFPDRLVPDASRAYLGANAAYIDELRTRLTQMRRNKDGVRIRLAQTIQEAHTRAAVARRSLETYAREIAPRARQAFATMRERYNTAKTPFIEYLDAGRTFLDAVLKTEEFRRDLNRALLDLQDAVGSGPGVLLPR